MLFDTSVAVDFLRGGRGAIAYVAAMQDRPEISAITVAELFVGLRSQRLEAAARRFIHECRVLSVTQPIAEAAGNAMRHYRGSHGLELADALIASTAEHHGLPLATLNVKHFPMFPRLRPAY